MRIPPFWVPEYVAGPFLSFPSVSPFCYGLALVFQLLDLQALAALGWWITARAVSSNVAHNWASSLESGG